MTNANFRRTLVGAAVAAALGVLAAPASAAPYRGVFDPVDFEGAYVINVSPVCLETDGWHANEGDCAATLLDVYADVVSYGGPAATYTGRLTFAPPHISSSSVLFGIYVYGGFIDSIDTALIHQQSGVPTTGDDDWWIQFASGQMSPPCDPYCTTDFVPQGGPIPEKAVTLHFGDPPFFVASAAYIGNAVDIGGVAVPEPSTISLLLGALGGGWLARRRRKEKVPDPN